MRTTYNIIISILGILLLLNGCGQKTQQRFCAATDVQHLPNSFELNKAMKRKMCTDALAYATSLERPNERPVRYIRTNFHIINTNDGRHNFKGEEGIKYIKNLVNNANSDLRENAKMSLPVGNDIPVLPPNLQIQIVPHISKAGQKGIYFHRDDELCFYVHKGKNRNLFTKDVIDKYAIQEDSVINVFIMPHHPDSVASKTYRAGGVGVALGTNMKMAGMFESGKPFWYFRMVLNHELGHILGLQHAWTSYDGCDDTPKHANCWNGTKRPECGDAYSNNMMDYNAHQKALTPCQIGRIHRSMSDLKHRSRKMLVPTWCELDVEKSVFIRDSVTWNGARDLEGHIAIQSGGLLRIACRVSMPKSAKIVVEEGATLIVDNALIHNACGDEWLGIELRTRGNNKGTVQFIGDARLENVVHEI